LVIVLGVCDRRFQVLAHVAGDALARELEIGQRGCHLLAADELRNKVELLRAHPQHARDRFGLVVRERAFPLLLAHGRLSTLRAAAGWASAVSSSRSSRGGPMRAPPPPS